MISTVLTITKMTKEKKQIKTKIWMGSVVKEKVGYMEYKTREGIRSTMRIDVVGCVQYVLGKKILLVQL